MSVLTEWWWAYLAVGAFVGFFSGLLGIGGGSSIVPVLAFIFAAEDFSHAVHLALGTTITVMLFTSAASVLSHHRRQSVNWRALRMLTPGILTGTFGGALIAGYLDVRLLTIAFTALIFYFATQMLRASAPRPAAVLPRPAVMSGFGAFVGFISSLSATGGATLVVPFLIKRNVSIHQAIGTASGVGGAIAAAGAAGYMIGGAGEPGLPPYSVGYVYLPALVSVAVTSMALAPVGAAVAHRTPGPTLRKIFAVVLFALATTMLVKFV